MTDGDGTVARTSNDVEWSRHARTAASLLLSSPGVACVHQQQQEICSRKQAPPLQRTNLDALVRREQNAQFHWCTTIGARWLLRAMLFLRRRAAVRMQECIVQSSPRHQVRTKGSSTLAHHVKLCANKESIDVHTKASAVARSSALVSDPQPSRLLGFSCLMRA
jgi:hypothetical protein